MSPEFTLTYLGVEASLSGFEMQTCALRLKMCAQIKHRLIKVLRAAKLGLQHRVKLYRACLHSSMLYGQHAVGLTTAVLRRLVLMHDTCVASPEALRALLMNAVLRCESVFALPPRKVPYSPSLPSVLHIAKKRPVELPLVRRLPGWNSSPVRMCTVPPRWDCNRLKPPSHWPAAFVVKTSAQCSTYFHIMPVSILKIRWKRLRVNTMHARSMACRNADIVIINSIGLPPL